ncbi:hypothetical protein CONCODRAFT_32552, partial [Conidiobolus coronatus NRRL 28638]
RKHPFLFFGLPFISIIVGASFFMTRFTQTRYDYQKTRTQIVSQEQSLKIDKDRKKFNIQEEYWRLMEKQDELDDWDNKRVYR